MSKRERRSGLARIRRLGMALPALPLIMLLEPELAVLGVDAFDFAGSILRKVAYLSERAAFLTADEAAMQARVFNAAFNAYCKATRKDHRERDFMSAETTAGAHELAVEREAFQLS